MKKVPYKTHLMLDTVVGAAAIAMPWLLGFANKPAAHSVIFGAGLLSEPDVSQGYDREGEHYSELPEARSTSATRP